MTLLEIKLFLTLSIMLIIPGWAFLTIGQIWKRWSVLQRWIIAVGLSISFYPTLFYVSRSLFPQLRFGPNKVLFLLFVLSAVVVYGQWKNWKEHFSFDSFERIVILVFGLSVFTRLWMAHINPYPAWADSLHHVLITQLVAQNGSLPYTLAPYEPSSLQMYHLGLYAITGAAKMLSGATASIALLWGTQFINGLSGIGAYFVMDRLVGRKGALVSAVVISFISYQPAWYFNWGRFPQVVSQAVMLIAWGVTIETMAYWGKSNSILEKWSMSVCAALLNAGVFLIHFRAAGLYIPLLGISTAWQLVQAMQMKKLRDMIWGVSTIGIIAFLLVSPALWPSLQTYVQGVASVAAEQSKATSTFSPLYYSYTLSAYQLGAQTWLLILALAALIVGILHRNKVSFAMLLWLVMLWLIGNAYRVGWYWLSFINYTGILIMFYLPIAITIGTGVEILLRYRFLQNKTLWRLGLEILLFFGILFSFVRVIGVEEYRFFLTEPDIRAMSWINQNIPRDAIFAINTYLWNNKVPHGTDAGYWIPYYTERRTTTGTMMFTSAPEEYVNQVLTWSKLVVNLNHDPASTKTLCAEGVKYVYIGPRGNFFQPGLDFSSLSTAGAKVLYQQEGVTILGLCN